MLALYCWFKAWWQSEEAQDLIEYALIIGLMVVVAVLALGLLGTQISTLWSKIGVWLSNKASGISTT